MISKMHYVIFFFLCASTIKTYAQPLKSDLSDHEKIALIVKTPGISIYDPVGLKVFK